MLPIRTAGRVAYNYDKSKALAKIAELQAKSGEFKTAIQTAKSIQMDFSRSETLARIAGLRLAVDKDGAKIMFDAAIDTAKNIEYLFTFKLYCNPAPN